MAERPADRSGLDWQPLTVEDLAELSALLTAIEHLDEPNFRHSLAELHEQYAEVDTDAGTDTLGGRDAGGTLVAYAWNHRMVADADPRRVYLSGGVHPGWRRQGIGSALLRWQLDEARRWYVWTWVKGHGPLQVICPVDEKLTDPRKLYADHGLQPIRWYADLSRTFEEPPPEVPPPPGVRLVRMHRDHSEDVRRAHNECFADQWGSQPIDRVHWEEQLSRAASRIGWSWVALADGTGEVVGYATNSAYEQDWEAQGFSEGWTDRLGVRPAWRGRGIAKALLAASMQSYAAAGLDAAGLGVDTDNPSFRLYEQLGFRSVNTVVLYGLSEDLAAAQAALRGGTRPPRPD